MTSGFHNNQLVFFVGRGRSGTTLLSKILNTHPQISIAPEGLFIRNLYHKYKNVHWNQNRLRAFINDVFLERKMDYWEVDEVEFKNKYVEKFSDTKSFEEACLNVYRCYALFQNKPGDVVLGDKNPHYSLYIRQLKTLYPDALFVHLVRDYRDNVLSFKNVDFDVNNTAALAKRWNIFNKKIISSLRTFPNHYYRLSYENLVADPETTLQALCKYLSIPYDRRMLSFYIYQKNEKRPWHKNIKKPLSSAHLYRWKSKMISSDLSKVESICGNMGRDFDYLPSLNNNQRPLPIQVLTGIIMGKIITFMENGIFYIPFKTRTAIMNFYRKMAGAK